VTLQEAYSVLNFWINKYLGSYFTPSELDTIVDRGQMALYTDLQPKYATSQRVKDALSPFRETWSFTPSSTISGYLPVPTNLNFLNLLDVQIEVPISGRTLYVPVTMVNEDERALRLNSQIDPVTSSSPIGEITKPSSTASAMIKIWPLQGYTGVVTFLRRPVKPYFAYTTISERVIVYDETSSVQLEWRETEIDAVLLKALASAGINLTDQEVSQFAEMKNQNNFFGVNKF
jgi:hypothetical protein